MPAVRLVQSLSFPVRDMPASLRWLLGEFRLLVNRFIRIALREDVRSRSRLTKVAYRTLSQSTTCINSTFRASSKSPSGC